MDFLSFLICAGIIFRAFKSVEKRLDVIEKKLGIVPDEVEVKSNW